METEKEETKETLESAEATETTAVEEQTEQTDAEQPKQDWRKLSRMRYSGDFKKMVLATMRKENLSCYAAAKRFGLSDHKIVSRWRKRYRDEGVEGLYHQKHRPRKPPEERAKRKKKPKKRAKRYDSPTMRLKICAEYLSGRDTAENVAKKYHIATSTLRTWLRRYKKDYASFLDFYRFIMGELAANGFRKAAEYLRDYAVEILTDEIGDKPPFQKMDFTRVLGKPEKKKPKSKAENADEDDLGDDLAAFDLLRKNPPKK